VGDRQFPPFSSAEPRCRPRFKHHACSFSATGAEEHDTKGTTGSRSCAILVPDAWRKCLPDVPSGLAFLPWTRELRGSRFACSHNVPCGIACVVRRPSCCAVRERAESRYIVTRGAVSLSTINCSDPPGLALDTTDLPYIHTTTKMAPCIEKARAIMKVMAVDMWNHKAQHQRLRLWRMYCSPQIKAYTPDGGETTGYEEVCLC
jgi:hypothetical protein